MRKPSPLVPPRNPASTSWLDRRGFLIGAGVAGMASGAAIDAAYTQIVSAADYSLRIAPLQLELAPGKVIQTFGYNGTVRSRTMHELYAVHNIQTSVVIAPLVLLVVEAWST